MILDIVQLGDPVLRRKAHKIQQIDKDIRILAQDMVDTLHDAGGVGLAGPQVGESIRIIIVEYPEDDTVEDSPMKLYKFINPEIIWHSEETEMGQEGCLSIPGFSGDVERWTSIKVKGLTVFGRPQRITATGWLARIFQHEIDHLEGVCYVDRASEIYRVGENEAEEEEAEEAETPAEPAPEADESAAE